MSNIHPLFSENELLFSLFVKPIFQSNQWVASVGEAPWGKTKF